MKNFSELVSAVASLSEKELRSAIKSDAVIFDAVKASKIDSMTVVRFLDCKNAIDDRLSKLVMSVDVDYCNDNRLQLFYLVSNDETQSYIAKMYLYSVNSDTCRYQIFLHKRLLDVAITDSNLKQFVKAYKKTFVLECKHDELVKVLKFVRALSKAQSNK